MRREALRALHYLSLSGADLQHGEFRTNQAWANAPPSARWPRCSRASSWVHFDLPLHALRFYFPALWPEAKTGAGAP